MRLKAVVREIPRNRGRTALSPNVIRAAQEGDDFAWTLIYRAMRQRVLRVARAKSRAHGADLDDLEAHIWVVLWTALPKHEPIGSFDSWVYAVTRNAVLNWFRDRRQWRKLHAEWPEDVGKYENMEFEAPSDPRIEEAAIARQELRWRLDKIEREVSSDARHAVEMHANGWPCKIIAEVLGTSPGNVRKLRHRALSRFPDRVASTDKNRISCEPHPGRYTYTGG